jgi:hypothetical protein
MPQGITSQKTEFFIATDVKTSKILNSINWLGFVAEA